MHVCVVRYGRVKYTNSSEERRTTIMARGYCQRKTFHPVSQADGRIDRRRDRRTDRWANGRMGGQADGRVDGCTGGRTGGDRHT